jgi:N-acetyl-gamma-glutamyl-phosphate reductase
VYFKYDAEAEYVVVTTAIDNVLKGAASQAVQCANLTHNYPITNGLIAQPVESNTL